MKIKTFCILSIGLSLAVFSEAARDKHSSKHHHHTHHKQHAANRIEIVDAEIIEHFQQHQHVAPAGIPNLPYVDKKMQSPPPPKSPAHINIQPVETPSAYEPAKAVEPTHDQKGPLQNNIDDSKKKEPEAPAQSGKKDKMVIAYWTDWTSGTMPPEAIPFEKVTHINYAFAVVKSDFLPVFETDYLLRRVVREAHKKNVKVLMSIGGWTGSQYFSPLAASEHGRKTFIDGAIKMVKDYSLDGIDIDWEYPGRIGSACNIVDEKNDTKNFLMLLKELREALNELPQGHNLEISLATRIVPFDGPDGIMKDVTEFAKVVDFINVMAYDINGSWSTVTGANAPLSGSGPLTYINGAQAWIDAGFPAEQINMGVPFYGRSLIAENDMTRTQSIASPFVKEIPIGDNNDGLWTDPCEKTASYSGVWKFKNLREQGVIDEQGNARAPWVRTFDQDSQTPWLFNPETKQFISYDDRKSLQLKVDYAKREHLGGMMLWALNQDTTDFELLEVLQDVRKNESKTTMVKVTSRYSFSTEITGIAYTPDGSNVVTTGTEFTMHLFPQKGDRADSNAVKIETDEQISCLVATHDKIFTGSSECNVRQYSIRERRDMGIVIRCDLKVRSLAMSPDENLLAVGSEEPDIKMINLEDPEKCWSFRGHKKAINSLSFDPLGEFMLSSSCDGTVIVWDLRSRDAKPLEIITILPSPTTTDSTTRIPVAWHPSSEFFVVGNEVSVVAYHRHTWKKSFTYRTGATTPIRCLAWSANGRFLAAASTKSDLWIWQYKEKENPLLEHKHENGGITGVAWAPNANRLVYSDTTGEFSRWDDVIDAEKGSPFNQPKPDVLAGLFDDAAVEDRAIEDQDMGQEFLDDNESLNDFIVEDDESSKYLEKRPTGKAANSRGAMQERKELHPPIQSGSTSEHADRRYLEFNLLGLITTVNQGTHATVSVEFHDKVTHRGYHFTDNSRFSMACLGTSGALFAAISIDDSPSTVFYKTYDSWATKSEWQVYLPEGEDVTAIALNAESAIVTTSRGYVRVFSQSGIQTGLFTIGSVIGAAGKDDMVLFVYHQGEPFEGSQNLGYAIYNVETGQRIQQGQVPVSDETYITWLGFSEGGIPAFYDDKGVMFILNYYRRVDQGQWTPILDTALVAVESETGVRAHYWPVGFTDTEFTCVKCRRGETEPSYPKPFVTELPLKMPTLYQESLTGEHEEGWLRQKILSGLNKDEKMAMSLEQTDNVVARKELEMDKLALQMIDLACRSERTQKALDLTAMLCHLKSIDAAVKIAHHHNLHSLMERMNKVKEIKMMQEQDRDPDTERDLIMSNPVLATPSSRDQSVYQVTSREEEQELQRRTFQRRDPVAPNDPFGRRVIKDTATTSNRTSAGMVGSSGSGIANPFKKKSGGGSGAIRATVPKGFGNVVNEADKNALPITRRATDVFEAADYLAADEQRSRAQREKQSRQEDLLRKRKANSNQGSSSSSANGGQQKTLSMFSKTVSASSSSSAAEAKRFKRQQEGNAENEAADVDMMMDADDFLEDTGNDEVNDDDDDEREESLPPPAQWIPPTQDEELLLDESIEETRGHLEKTRVAHSSQSPAKSSSSVLAGFKFNRA
ncbi:hypothetical protein BGZ51_007978 [Haplosporangium sp. Z 767]|nr:hypothetical protein BGZ51_007978 [Haplosporangium sp. Z 767]